MPIHTSVSPPPFPDLYAFPLHCNGHISKKNCQTLKTDLIFEAQACREAVTDYYTKKHQADASSSNPLLLLTRIENASTPDDKQITESENSDFKKKVAFDHCVSYLKQPKQTTEKNAWNLLFPMALTGQCIVDLGCGIGNDCVILSCLGAQMVKGIDMCPIALQVANENLHEFQKQNFDVGQVEFQEACIDLPECTFSTPESIDICYSKCVVCLSPKKDRILQNVYNMLKSGGEFFVRDVFCDRRIQPCNFKEDIELWCEGFTSSMYIMDFIQLCHVVGFTDLRFVQGYQYEIPKYLNDRLPTKAQFYYMTFRIFKVKNCDRYREDYGDSAIYQGHIPACPDVFTFDVNYTFPKNQPVRVDRKMFRLLQQSRFLEYFKLEDGASMIHHGPASPYTVEEDVLRFFNTLKADEKR